MTIKITLSVLFLWMLLICSTSYKFMEKFFINLIGTMLIVFAYSYNSGMEDKRLYLLACFATSACVVVAELFNHHK